MLGYHKDLTLSKKDQGADKRQIGTGVHKALETFHVHGFQRDGVQVWIEENAPEGPLDEGWQKARELVNIMADGYADWYEAEGFGAEEETLAVEHDYEMLLGTFGDGEEVVLTGRIDRVFRDLRTGNVVIEDWKTVGSLDQEPGVMNDQLLTYATLWNALGKAADDPCHDARHTQLKKVKRTARAKPPFYGHVPVHISQEQLDNHLIHLASVVSDMVFCTQTLNAAPDGIHHAVAYPTPMPDRCKWDCDFLPVCELMDDGSDWKGMCETLYVPRETEVEVTV